MQLTDKSLEFEISLGRITFLSAEEKQILKKNLDSSHSLAISSIEDIENLIHRKLSSRVIWDGEENLKKAQTAAYYCRQMNIQVLIYTDPEYPELLRQISDPPYMLFCRGEAGLLSERSVSVVGTRRLSQNGKEAAKAFAYDASFDGCNVVSGLANGADGFAHQGAVNAWFDCVERNEDCSRLGKTIAVLPGSIDEILPASHRKLASQILNSGGLLISEYEPKLPMAVWHYVGRNRIIAGLSPATVVIEAPAGSGALITADFALENGRDVMFHEVTFSANANQISKIVKNQLVNEHAAGKVSKYKVENTPEKYLEAGAPVIKSYKDYLVALKETPGLRSYPVQGTLFDIE